MASIENISKLLDILVSSYPQVTVAPGLIVGYACALEEFDEATILGAIKGCVKAYGWFPKASEIVAACRGVPTDDADREAKKERRKILDADPYNWEDANKVFPKVVKGRATADEVRLLIGAAALTRNRGRMIAAEGETHDQGS